jgi:hypothetical protein
MHKAAAPAMHKAAAPAAWSPAPVTKKATGYIAPQKRVENPLAPENFPVFRNASVIHTTSKLNFKEMMQKAEEARAKALEAESYDPRKLQMLLPGQLEKEGWNCLSLPAARTFNERAPPQQETGDDPFDYWRPIPLDSAPRPTLNLESETELNESYYESEGEKSVDVIVDED